MNLTAEYAKEFLRYDPETGYFFWIKSTNRRIKVGSKAGSMRPDGYLSITVNRIPELCHRLAWKMTYGDITTPHIDHVNGVKDDNRISNLRLATPSENGQNRRGVVNPTGLMGVCWSKKDDRFVALIKIGGVQMRLGYYRDAESAHQAYLRAKAIYHPFVAGQEEYYASS